ncbi:OLC1v1038040C1 [Oldenlandia corymbosa var. corymbosa]|uniref:OLC1v1038040C1 n=1 Tax=Oldenlandia corymbosa var. corymbosa TaxID=529605 RepID=A0AAV1CYZ5_OLDCO|nr:OLC1v1038040C1 [Oldenlandia corymbosa var. corymbosa]
MSRNSISSPDGVGDKSADVELRRHRTVQELAEEGGGEVPEGYICRKGDRAASAVPLVDVPVIDLKLSASPDSVSDGELQKLQSALSSWGFFQVINHGIDCNLLDKLRENTRQFFRLPAEEKHIYARGPNEIEGYGNDMVLYENQTLDWTDRLYLLVHPEDSRKLHYWPQNPKSFRIVLEEYTTRLRVIVEILFKSMAKSLGLAEDCFLNKYGDTPMMHTRFNFYPLCPKPDVVQGVKPHADGTAITILLPDEKVEGLQFLKDDQWIRTQINPHALLVNVGDQMEMMSNGIFKSPVHRVITNSYKERISVATFCSPGSGEEVGPVEELINDTRPRLYKTVKDYYSIYFKYYQLGKRPIEAVRL